LRLKVESPEKVKEKSTIKKLPP